MIEGKGLSAIRNSNINSSFCRESEAKDTSIFSKMQQTQIFMTTRSNRKNTGLDIRRHGE